jgi:glycosyltransferase involved in cell wall biosynthesis
VNILYLYSELVGYQIPIFEIYVKEYKAQVHVISWDKYKLKPYQPPVINGVTFYKRSEYSVKALLSLAMKINPDIIYISGWMDKGYLWIAKYFRKKGIKIVTAFDDKWSGSFRQRIGSIFASISFKLFYSHAWVAGSIQYEFAKKMGFKNDDIIFDMLSGNTNLFQKGMEFLTEKKDNYPKVFLYVGNFRFVKGTDILVKAFKKYRHDLRGDWKLMCVGGGEYKHLLENDPNIEIIDFSNEQILLELTKRAGVFILPSRNDKWGVVVHEFASAGLPLILSRGVGAIPTFFIEHFNGISFSKNSSTELAKAMFCMSTKSVDELIEMSKNSHLLSTRISPKTSAANFMSLILAK